MKWGGMIWCRGVIVKVVWMMWCDLFMIKYGLYFVRLCEEGIEEEVEIEGSLLWGKVRGYESVWMQGWV